MAVDSNFATLFQNLKLDDPWLPSKPWESIPSESGVSHSETSSEKFPHEPLYESSTLSEANLVRLVINALQGVESTLISIEKLSESFCLSPADRTSHRIPSLWYRSSSSSALGKILKSVGHAGLVALLLRKFVDYFLCTNSNVDVISREEGAETKGVDSNNGDEMATHHGYSLVNHAFSVAVGKILEGYVCALDTLYASVQMRRSEKKIDASVHEVGCLTSVVHSEITLLEVYLHTKELRTRIEALGNICLLSHVARASSTTLNDSIVEAATEFSYFPRGGNLLTYLYAQLRDADPVHHALLKFLFVRSCEPYCGFIESWIYQARINDPYKEFIVEYLDEYAPFPYATAGFSLTSIKERDGVAVPCFLKDICLPLVRAGQQLQVLVKLLDLCRYLCPGDENYKDVLPFWTGASSDHSCNLSPLTFSKRDMDEMVLMRENMYKTMHEKLQILFTNLDVGYQQKSRNATFGTIFVEENRSDAKFPGSFTFDDNMIFLSSKAEKGDLNLEAASLDSEASSATDEFSYEEDPWESSECSSLNSAGDLNDSVGPAEPHESSIDVELKYLSASVLHSNNGKVFSKPSQGERLNAPRHDSHKSIRGMDSISHFVDTLGEETKLGNISEHFQSGDAKQSCLSKTQYVDYQSVVCWPLGGLPKNPFNVEGGYKDETQSELTNCSLKVSEGDVPNFGEVLACDNSLTCQSKVDALLENGIYASSDSFLFQSWDSKYKNKFFSMNPMLTKHAWLPKMDKSRSSSFIGYTQSSLPCFHFSSVQDPLMVFGERMLENLDRGFQSGLPSCVDFAVRMDGCVGEQGHDEGDILVDQRHSSSTFPLTFSENQQEGHVLTNASGGAEWENSLNYSGISVIHNAGAPSHSSGDAFNLPLDVIIDKCILHQISLQYKYVSNFTITLLEKGFDLREHLLALRRYHFMEVADWADLFIMSLWRHKRYAAEANQRISKVQGFLDMAVKRSSCAGDVYKEQLFVYMKGHGMTPLPTSTYGIHAFDFIALGYRVDWPVSIVITLDSLKIYAEIFSFLIQVKLAVFALTDMWCLLKDLVPLVGQNQDSGLGKQDKSNFDILMKMRHQVNHFVSTLQQYVQSQLSHVSWGRFLHALKHQVKDMLDLESVHMAYLADSLHICFLSDETKSVADIIDNILQCALDFRSCFTCGGWEVGSDLNDSFKLLTRLKLSQVLTIKETFERNLKELYLCYLKSPKHTEYGLCRFWGFLNYNDYYSNVIGNARSFHVL